MSLLDDLKKSTEIRQLFERNHDVFEASFSVWLKYMKNKGNEKPLLLVVTKLNAYALKPSYEVIKKFSLDSIALKLDAGKLYVTNKKGEPLFTMHGERKGLVDATATIKDLAQKLSAPIDVKKKPSPKFTPSQTPLTYSRPPTEPRRKHVNADDHNKQKRQSKQFDFLIQNIVAADDMDYQGIRSIYPQDSDNYETSVSLINQLSQFLRSRDEEVENVVSTSASTFFEAVQDCEAVKPGVSQALHRDVADISDRVSSRTEALLVAGAGVRKYQLEYKNIKDAISHIEMCQSAAALHTKAEKFVSERKFYPAVLTLDDLEFKVRPLLRHEYGKWVFEQAIPELRKKIKTEIHQDFNKWMSSARVMADPIGAKALAWARERIVAFDKSTFREIELVDTFDDYTLPQQRAGPRPRLGRRLSSMFDIASHRGGGSGATTDGTETSANSVSDHEDDWADDLVWDVRISDNTRSSSLRGAAQFLAALTDMLIVPQNSKAEDDSSHSGSPPQTPTTPATPASSVEDAPSAPLNSTSSEITFKVVHQNICVMSCLDPTHGLDTLRQYYLTNRQRQLQLRLQSPKSLQDVMSPKWLAGLAGFFLVDLIVAQSTYPPLVQEFHVLGFWDQTVQVLQTWLERAAAEVTRWEELLALKERCHELAVALEELWAVAGDCSYRLDPLYEGIVSVRKAAMEKLHFKAMHDIVEIMGKDKYQLVIPYNPEQPEPAPGSSQGIKKKNSLPGMNQPPSPMISHDPEALCKKYFLHLSNGGKCCSTVLQVMDVLTAALDASFIITRGSGDVDDEVRGQIESLLRHVACQLDERAGKLSLSQIYAMQICMQSVNAGAYDAAALSLSRGFAQRASSNYIDDNGRLRVFSSARRRLRDCQSRLEQGSIRMLHSRIKNFMDALTPVQWSPDPFKSVGAHTPLTDLKVFLSNVWKKRTAMLPNLLSKRMQSVEVGDVDACLSQLCRRIVNSESILRKSQSVINLRDDVHQIKQLCEPDNLTLSLFESQFESMLKTAADIERRNPNPPPAAAPVAAQKPKDRFAFFRRDKK